MLTTQEHAALQACRKGRDACLAILKISGGPTVYTELITFDECPSLFLSFSPLTSKN